MDSSLLPADLDQVHLPSVLSFAATLLVSGLLMGLSVAVSLRAAQDARLRRVLPLLVVPAVFLLLVSTFAVHMHSSLGGWPASLGDHGFPARLIVHGEVAYFLFGALLLGLLFNLPAGLVVCSLVPRLRSALQPLALHAGASLVALLLLQLAPEPFLDWWWD